MENCVSKLHENNQIRRQAPKGKEAGLLARELHKH